jgi:adenylate cyclase
MASPALARHGPVLAGTVLLALILIALALLPGGWREEVRETAFDSVLVADQRVRREVATAPVTVVEIDRRALATIAPWPWPRETVAKLIANVAAAKPAAIAVDILFAEPDPRSPATLARRLGELTGRSDLTRLGETLVDSDELLAGAADESPVAFGFVLDPERMASMPGAPILIRGAPVFGPLWGAAGVIPPVPALMQAGSGLGALSLPGDADGLVRRAPLLVAVDRSLQPGLAIESVRLARQASAYRIEANPLRLIVGDVTVALPQDGLMRLAPVDPSRRLAATLSAADVMAGTFERGPLAGAIVLVGGSAPELGGLRATPGDSLTPSVQIQGDAVRQILAGRVPQALPRTATLLAVAGLGIAAIALGAAVPPLIGGVAMLGLIAVTWVAAIALSLAAERLFDPLSPSLAGFASFVVVSVAAFAQARRREALVRRRFEQHLAPAVVERIVRDPELLKLSGERREVTALFTDVEGFTLMTQAADPQQLVAALDDYFEGLTAIVLAHGGMVDKIVGDAVHALFNAPLDLAEHATQAIDCAIEMRDWARDYRQRAEPRALGFGRTRIGVETGLAIVGDVGISTKLDYTAHGDAVNVTARLEAANKELGSAICVGPNAASRGDPARMRPLGAIAVRGRDGLLDVFEPWPEDVPAAWRARYLDAYRMIGSDRPQAIAAFEALAHERPDDPVPRRMAERLRAPDPH